MIFSGNAELTGQRIIPFLDLNITTHVAVMYCGRRIHFKIVRNNINQSDIISCRMATNDDQFIHYVSEDETHQDMIEVQKVKRNTRKTLNKDNVNVISLPELDNLLLSEFGIDLSPAQKDRFNSKRLNAKETKRRNWRKRQTRRQQILPHSDDLPVIPEEPAREELEVLNDIIEDTPTPPEVSRSELQDLLDACSGISKYADNLQDQEQIDEWVGHFENLALLGYQISRARDFSDVFSAVCFYVKTYSKSKSVIIELYRILNEVVNLKDESDTIEPHSLEFDARDALTKWDLFKSHKMFAKISYLMSAAMSLTVCTTKKIEWSPLGLKLISVEAAKEQLYAVDVIDALVRTFVWVSDVGWRCFETRSLEPLLYADSKIQDYNEKCDFVLAKADMAIAGNVEDLGAFESKLTEVLAMTCKLKASRNEGPAALWLQKRYSELIQIKDKLHAKRKNTDLRFQPFGVSLHGGTGVGKTTLGKLTMLQSLAAMGFAGDEGVVDESRILTLDLFDKYQSTYTSDILGVFMDDIGNTKSQFTSDNPHTAVIIKFFNNVAAQAIKAELNAKGVVFIDFKVGIATTNVKDMDARSYSNCPESILRRFYHVRTEVKEKFRKSNTTMLDSSHPEIKASEKLTLDVWKLTVERVETYQLATGKEGYRFSPVTFTAADGTEKQAVDIGLEEYLALICKLSKDHKEEQDLTLWKSKKSSKTKFCAQCSMFPEFCKCGEMKPHSMDVIANAVLEASTRSFTQYVDSWRKRFNLVYWLYGFSPVQKLSTEALTQVLQRELNYRVTPFVISWIPEHWLADKYIQRLVGSWQDTIVTYEMTNFWRLVVVFSCFICVCSMFMGSVPLFMIGVIMYVMNTCIAYVYRQRRLSTIEQMYLQRRDALPEYAKRFRDGSLSKGILYATTLCIGVKLLMLWNERRLKNKPHAITPDDVDEQPSWFGWLSDSLQFTMKSKVVGSTPEHLRSVVESHLGRADFTGSDGKTQNCNVIYPMKGVIWFPRHIMHKNGDVQDEAEPYMNVLVRRGPNNKTSQFRCSVEIGVNAVIYPELDIVCAFTSRCPDIKDNFVKHLPEKVMFSGTTIGTMLVRNKVGTMSDDTFNVTFGEVGHKFMTFKGGEYNTPLAINGSCMAPIVTEGKRPTFCGFHMGGNGRGYGIMMTITRTQAEEMIEKLLTLPGVRGLSQAVDLPRRQYDKELLASEKVHSNAKIFHKMDNTAEIDQLGSTKLRAESKSRVERSCISPHVEKYFGIKNCWGAPRLKPNWEAFNATLVHIVKPSAPFIPSVLERARRDWVDPIVVFARELCKKESIRPLTLRQITVGVPGKRFYEGMPMDTSMGSPEFRAKHHYFTDVWENGVLVDRVPCEEVMEEYNRMEQAWERGERAYPVTVATLKDEPTPLGKEKVRVFQAGAAAFGMHIRKYFLPIARVLSLNPLLSESAVGVNAFGPQWLELMNHSEKYMGDDERILAYDYSKYDVRMGGDITYAVLMSFIDIAEACDYSQRDLDIMNAMVADMIHPLIDYNGTMIMAYNLNTSGNNITVNINGCAGSLYPRMHFYENMPWDAQFRDYVALMTYGDDAKGSVKEEIRGKFNFMSYKEFLARHDMKITLPDKSDDECEDLSVENADFLKRKSNYIPEIGTKIGMLDEMSIFKSLHSNLKSKTATPREVAASCIQGAMHEWFAHGREVYEDRREKMLRVCDDAKLPVPAVRLTFDERVEHWKKKYGAPLDTNEPKA